MTAETLDARADADVAPMYDMIELFYFAYRDFVGDADRLLEAYGFGRAHHRVLHFVARHPGLTIAELLDILAITKQSLNRVLKELVAQDFIEARAGAADADPYTRARVQRDGEIPLGLGEGLRLTTDVDSDGRALDSSCVYRFGPHAPPARYWTLAPIDAEGFPIANAAGRYVLRSSEILRDGDGGFAIYVSARAHAGNWLPLGARGRFALALRLYDAALSGAAVGIERAAAPKVTRERCG